MNDEDPVVTLPRRSNGTEHLVDPLTHLDTTDRNLIELLKRDGRATFTALARQLDLSVGTIRARMKRLLDEQIITINGWVDPTALHYGVYVLVLVHVRGNALDVAERITPIPEAAFVAATSGSHDLIVEIRCRDHIHVLDVLDQLRQTDGVVRTEEYVGLKYLKQDYSGIGLLQNETPRQPPLHGRQVDLDEIDRQLVHALVADGRATYAALAELVGLSQPSVRDRVVRLLENVVRIAVMPGPESADGLSWSVVLVNTDGAATDVGDAIARFPETTLVTAVSGRCDLGVELWARSNYHMLETLERLRSVPGVTELTSIPYLRILKQDFSGGAV